jgi:hypothetical protein
MENTSRNRNRNRNGNEINIEIVVARYNEDLSWLHREPFNQYPNIIYNKGKTSIDKFPKTHEVIELENTGREYASYLHHIISNYNNLANITVFLPGSTDNWGKEPKARRLLAEVEKHQDSVFIGVHYDNIGKDLFYFHLDDYSGTDIRNDVNQKMTPANIRPFGIWYLDRFQKLITQKLCHQGIVSISRRDVLRQPISYYQSFLDELSVCSNPEVGHYIERSWQAIFYRAANPLSLTTINEYPDASPDDPSINRKKIVRMNMRFTKYRESSHG